MKIKIRNSSTGPNLCEDCSHAQIITYENQERCIFCKAVSWKEDPILMTKKVIKCSNYDEAKAVSLWDMRHISWILRTDKSGRAIGFTPYKDVDAKTKEQIDEL